MKAFASEAQLVRIGRRVIRSVLKGIPGPVRTKYEVQAPGGVPDLVVFNKLGNEVTYVIAVEFKLQNWRRALQQAFRHRNFVNEAYVVLDEARSARALEHLTLFQQANVGLVTIDRDEVVRVSHFPEPGLPFSSRFAHSLARNLLATHRQPPPNHPFIRSIRGGVQLAELRTVWK